MNFIVLTNSRVSLPVLAFLKAQSRLHCIYTSVPFSPEVPEINAWADAAGVPVFPLEATACSYKQLQAKHPGTILLSFAFNLRIDVSGGAPHAYNIHFSLLPRYAGPVPVFWQLRSGDPHGGVTLHRVAERFDAGEVIAQQAVGLLPGETYGLYSSRLAGAAVPLVAQLLAVVDTKSAVAGQPQDLSQRTYQRKPVQEDLCIDWANMTAAQVEQLVNACNPIASGAWTRYRQQPLQVVEVNPTDGQSREPGGTIVYADPAHGLFVACSDGPVLRIGIVRLPEGVYSGARMAALGFSAQTSFESLVQQQAKHSLIS